jgi:hypothetical protein
MKKIRLTESQLIDLIKKSVNKVKTINESQIINEVVYINPEGVYRLAKALVKNMAGGTFGDVTSDNLKKVYDNISQMRDWVWQDDGSCAVDKLLAYYKTYNKGTDFLTNLNDASESNDPEFDDLKAKIPKLITQLQQSCAAAKKKDVDDAATAKTAKDTALSSCASKEPGYVDQGSNFGLTFGKKGYIIAPKNGVQFRSYLGYNAVYWEYAKFHKGKTEDVLLYKTKATCVNGTLNLDAWEKA